MRKFQSPIDTHTSNQLTSVQAYTLIGLAGLLIFILWFAPGLTLLHYPFRLLSTIIHELSHGLTALITGGDFLRFVIFPNGSGLAYTAGGFRLLVIPAGYLGTALFGATLITIGKQPKLTRLALGGIGALMVLLCLRYGIPTLATHFFSGLLTIVSGVIFGLLFILVAYRTPPAASFFLLHLIAMETAIASFSDLFTLFGLSVVPGNVSTDAVSMSELTFLPAFVWSLIWILIAALLIGNAVRSRIKTDRKIQHL